MIDKPDDFPNVLCFFYPGSIVHGHVDWMVATASGHVSWLNFADDWDYNFRFFPQRQNTAPEQDRGLTTNNNRIEGGDAPRYMELEFASSEVADQFRTPWWQGLARLVDPLNLPELNKYIHPSDPNQDPFAVAVGLFGLDCEHDCRSEFHPVYALAIQLDENPSNNIWAIFVRNWGDEGFCSSLNHELNLADQKMSLLLPWPGGKGLKAEVEQMSPRVSAPSMGLLQDESGRGEGAIVTFNLPRPSERGLVEALLRFQWKGGAAISARAHAVLPLTASALHPSGEGEQDAERFLGKLKAKAGVTRQTVVTITAHPEPAVVARPMKLKVQVYRREHKAPMGTTGMLSKTPNRPVECGGPGTVSACPVDTAKQQRDIAVWKRICSSLKTDPSHLSGFPDEQAKKIRDNCAKIEALQ
ncbi:MAG TPA: hypothetical protein VEV41_24690 [Terriglobales bacterium]|nr:hypothetical protein [Terriglobales bacterium]